MPEGTYYIPAKKRPTKFGSTGPRPHVWVSGPDLVRHEQHIAWSKHKAQAAYRKEAHTLTYEQWCEIWDQDDAWAKRGRKSTATVLTRIDSLGAWSRENCHVILRYQHLLAHNQLRVGTHYKKHKEQK